MVAGLIGIWFVVAVVFYVLKAARARCIVIGWSRLYLLLAFILYMEN